MPYLRIFFFKPVLVLAINFEEVEFFLFVNHCLVKFFLHWLRSDVLCKQHVFVTNVAQMSLTKQPINDSFTRFLKKKITTYSILYFVKTSGNHKKEFLGYLNLFTSVVSVKLDKNYDSILCSSNHPIKLRLNRFRAQWWELKRFNALINFCFVPKWFYVFLFLATNIFFFTKTSQPYWFQQSKKVRLPHTAAAVQL